MDGRRFDQWTRLLVAGATSRRAAVRLLGGGVFGALLARPAAGRPPGMAPREAAAGCKKPGNKCRRNNDCCEGARCQGKRCRCKGNRIECGRRCLKGREFQRDPANCGACGNDCDPGQRCAEGACVTGQGTCADGADTCAGDFIGCGTGAGTCICTQSTEGATRCVQQELIIGTCGGCASSADCAAHGPGASCVTFTPPSCFCTTNDVPGETICALPCSA